MSYEFFLAKRYAFSKKKENFITVISLISMLGITVGTGALITVLSVFNGFSSVVTNILVSFDPHIRVSENTSDTSRPAPQYLAFSELEPKLAGLPNVQAVAPVVRGKAVLVHYTLPRVGILTGIDPDKAGKVSGLSGSIKYGELKLDTNSIVMGQLLADELAVIVGDTVQVFSPLGLERILTEPVEPRSRGLVVTGIFAANNREYDAMNAYTGLEAARYLFDVPLDRVTTVDLKLSDIRESAESKRRISSIVDTNNVSVQTWYDLHTDLYSVMEVERWISYVILFLIVLVASFNIFSSLTLTVYEKQRDIGLLRALGASRNGIRDVYLYQGLFIGAVGTVTGCLLGLAIVLLQQKYAFFPLDMSVYIIPALPVELRWADFVLVGVGSLLLSTLGAYMPARRAAKILPSVALRWE